MYIFDVAKEKAPSILLLEDLNLYGESNSPYAPEWACLQACIDEASDADIFVIATTNDTRYMPQSLLRPGRFDYLAFTTEDGLKLIFSMDDDGRLVVEFANG